MIIKRIRGGYLHSHQRYPFKQIQVQRCADGTIANKWVYGVGGVWLGWKLEALPQAFIVKTNIQVISTKPIKAKTDLMMSFMVWRK
jgi:hypothetical protein